MSDLDELLEVVDDNNQVVGKATRGESYKRGLLHRAINIFIYNSKGEIFLQKRSSKRLIYPLFWDLSCSEHVRSGESFEDATKRGLKEELGIEIKLEEIIPIHRVDCSFGQYLDKELVITFKGIYQGKMKFDPDEVEEGKYFNPKELEKLILEGKLKVTSWFLEDWKLLNSAY